MLVVESGWRALRGRITGASAVLTTGSEGLCPADSYDADGSGEVPKHYPQRGGTRPVLVPGEYGSSHGGMQDKEQTMADT
jgi:hypothetical protein